MKRKRIRNALPKLAKAAGKSKRQFLVDLMREHGSARAAAEACNVHESSIYNWLYANGIINTWVVDPAYVEENEKATSE